MWRAAYKTTTANHALGAPAHAGGRRCHLWLVDFGEPFPAEPAHLRPAVVLGPPDTFGPDFPFVIVCPLTTTHRGLALHIEVESTGDTGLDVTSYVQCELLRSVNRRRLVHRLGALDRATSRHVSDVLKILLNH